MIQSDQRETSSLATQRQTSCIGSVLCEYEQMFVRCPIVDTIYCKHEFLSQVGDFLLYFIQQKDKPLTKSLKGQMLALQLSDF